MDGALRISEWGFVLNADHRTPAHRRGAEGLRGGGRERLHGHTVAGPSNPQGVSLPKRNISNDSLDVLATAPHKLFASPMSPGQPVVSEQTITADRTRCAGGSIKTPCEKHGHGG